MTTSLAPLLPSLSARGRPARELLQDRSAPIHLSVIVPVYNGAARLPAALAELASWLDAQTFRTELILVDDCSRDGAAELLYRFASLRKDTRVMHQRVNAGKGAAVRLGMSAATGRYRIFIDADLAYPPPEIGNVLQKLEDGADVAIACRVHPGSRYVMSPSFFRYLYTRHLMSRIFNRLVRTVVLHDVLDSQAGLKGFTAVAADVIFPQLTIRRFGFDVESLFIAQQHGFTLSQVPVQFRYDDEPTSVRFASSVLQMAADLARVRLNHARHRYS